jgi:ABC-type transporter lipoprotein component MlaA
MLQASSTFPDHDEDFGQTLGTWGLGEGPYLYFLVMGPSNARDLTGFVVDRGLDPLTDVNWGDEGPRIRARSHELHLM